MEEKKYGLMMIDRTYWNQSVLPDLRDRTGVTQYEKNTQYIHPRMREGCTGKTINRCFFFVQAVTGSVDRRASARVTGLEHCPSLL